MRKLPSLVIALLTALIFTSCSPFEGEVQVKAEISFDTYAEWDSAELTIDDGFLFSRTFGPVTPEDPVFRIGIPEGEWKITVVTCLDGVETSRGGTASYLPFPLNGRLEAELFINIFE